MIVSTYPGKPLAGMEKYKKLYHFTSFDTFVRIWLSKKLKFGSMLEVNDIQESMKGISVSNSLRLPIMFAFQDIVTHYKQISFTMDQDTFIKGYMNTMMWGYYADKSHGVCIEFDYDKLIIPSDVLKGVVEYQDIVPQRVDLPDSVNTIADVKEFVLSEQKKLFFVKQKGWIGENEYRLVSDNHNYLDIDGAVSRIYLTSYESDECKWVEQLVDGTVSVMCLHYLNNLPIASDTKKLREQIEKARNKTGVLNQISEQAKLFYKKHKNDEKEPLVLNEYIIKT